MITTSEPISGIASAQGLDVSNFQGEFDWAAAKAQIPNLRFGMFRVTQGLGGKGTGSPDPDAAHNYAGSKAAGLEHGGYHFLNPRLSGQAQAEYFVKTWHLIGDGLAPLDMLSLDNETPGASPAAVAACADAFMRELTSLVPHNPRIVYTFIDFAREGNCAGLGGYPLWLAYPNSTAPKTPPPWTGMKFWQWGIRNGDDADAFMGTAGAFEAWLASYREPPLAAPSGLSVTPFKGGADFGWAPAAGTTETHFQVARFPSVELASNQLAVAGQHVEGLRLAAGQYGFRVSASAPRSGEWSGWVRFDVP